MTEQEYKKMILEQASTVKTKEDLGKLIDDVILYNHDYGTIVMGILGAMYGAFKVVNASPQGGITGFQAGCLAHELLQEFGDAKPPYKIMNFNKMLYPQYEADFQKVLSRRIFEILQGEAKESLLDTKHAHPDVVEHWKKIVAGEVPFGWELEIENTTGDLV